MSIQRQRRRGTAAENAAFTGALGEFTYITDSKRIAAHDGSTAGGTLFPSNRDLINDYFGYAAASGTDTITLTVLAQITAYAAGQVFSFKAAATNTGSATLNVNSLGAKTIKKKNTADGTIDALDAGDIINGGMYTVRYDGTDMQLISTDGAGSTGWEVLSRQTASASSSLDFTSLITAAHTSYRFTLESIRPATDTALLYMRTSTDNGSTFNSGATDYIYRRDTYDVDTGPVAATLSGGQATHIPLCPNAGIGNAAAEGLSGYVMLFDPLNTAKKKMIIAETMNEDSTGVHGGVTIRALRDATADIDAVRFIMSTGNITSGKITMEGLPA